MSRLFDLAIQKAEAIQSIRDAQGGRLREQMRSLASVQEQVAQEVEASKTSWAGKLADPQRSPVTHTIVDGVASLAKGISREAGFYAGAAYDNLRNGASTNSRITQDIRDAFHREKKGQATPADIKLLDSSQAISKNAETEATPEGVFYEEAKSNRQLVTEWFDTQKTLGKISEFFDISEVVDPRTLGDATRDFDLRLAQAAQHRRYARDLDAAGHTNDAVDQFERSNSKLVDSIVKFGTENPSAVLNTVAENLPSLALGAATRGVGLFTSAGGYAIDMKNQAYNDYIKKHGEMPSETEMLRIQALSAGAGSLEYLSDKLTLGAGKAVGAASKAINKTIQGLEKGALASVAKTGNALVNNPITRTAGGGLLAGTGEYFTEVGQTFAENESKREDSTGKDLHYAGTMGFWGGSGASVGIQVGDTTYTGVKAVKELYTNFKKGQQEKKAEIAANAAKDAVLKEAIDNGNPDVYLQPGENYSPEKALQVLAHMAAKKGITEDEKKSVFSKAQSVIEGINKELSTEKEKLTADIANRQNEVDLSKEYVELLKDVDPGLASEIEVEIQTQVQAIELLNTKVANLDRSIEKINADYQQMTAGAALETINATDAVKNKADVEAVNIATAETAAPALNRLRVLAMVTSASMNGLSIEDARNLANSEKLNEADRKFFENYAASEEAIEILRKSMGKVHSEVMKSDPATGQKSLPDYRERFGRAAAVNDKRGMERELFGLTKFMANTEQKLATVKEAVAMWKANPKNKSVVFKDESGKWSIRPLTEQDTEETAAANKELRIFGKAGLLISTMTNELDAMQKTMAFMESAGTSKAEFVDTPKTIAKDVDRATVEARIAQKERLIARISESMKDRSETGPDAEAAIGAKVALINQLNNELVTERANLAKLSEKVPATTKTTQKTVETGTPSTGTPKTETKVDTKPTDKPDEQKKPPVDESNNKPEEKKKPAVKKVKEAKPVTPEQQLKAAQKARRKVLRNKGISLWTVMKHTLSEADLSDTYGSEWKKRYTMLRGKPGQDLSTAVANGALNDFLPYDLRFSDGYDTDSSLEQDAVEYIKDKLRERNYLSYETQLALDQLDLEIEALEKILNPEDINEMEAFNEAREDTQDQVTEETTEASETSVTEERGDQKVEVVDEGTVEGSAEQSETDQGNDAGKLTVFSESDPKTERTRQSLKQKGKNKPLVQIKNLAKLLLNSIDELVQRFLNPENKKTIQGVGEAQKNALKAVAKAIPAWNDHIRKFLRNSDKKDGDTYYYRDVLGFITNEDGTLDDNILTAISVAALDWAAENGNGSFSSTDKIINRALRLDEDSFVTVEADSLLRYAGTPIEMVQNDLGNAIVDYLGLKEKEVASRNMLPKIRVALGSVALKVLKERGIVTSTVIDMSLANTGLEPNSMKTFIQFSGKLNPSNGRFELDDIPHRLANILRPLKDVLPRLMGTDAASKKPSFEPVSFTQSAVRKGTTAVPKNMAEILDAKNKQPVYLKLGNYNILRQFASVTYDENGNPSWDTNNKLIQSIIGIDTRSPGSMQAMLRGGILAKNEGLQENLEQLIAFVEGDWGSMGLEVPIYLQNVVWRNQRVGLVNTIMNPQTDKVARGLLYRKEWETKVTKTDESNEITDSFKLRVLEGFKVKTERTPNAQTIAREWNKLLSNKTVMAGVEVLQIMEKDANHEMTEEQKELVAAAVVAGKVQMHTLDALTALASWMNTKDGGTFTTTLYAEIDGVNNGPILTQLFMGSWLTETEAWETLNKGGMFKEGSNIESFSQYRPGKLDLYEENINAVSEVLKVNFNKGNAEERSVLNAIWNIAGKFTNADGTITGEGRDLIKTPINSLNFGSTTKTAVNNMAEEFLKSLSKRIESEVAKTPDIRKIPALIDEINVLLPESAQLDRLTAAEDLMNLELTKKQLTSIRESFYQAVGIPTEQVLEQRFATVLQRRDILNKAANVTFDVYNALYKAVYGQVFQEGVDSGELSREITKADGTKEKKPIWDISIKSEREIRNLLKNIAPLLGTAFSEASGSKQAGVALSKKGRMEEGNADLYTGKALFNDTKAASGGGVAYVPTEEGPGVSGQSMSIHSSDGFISINALSDLSTGGFNLHDAVQTGVGTSKQAAFNLNSNTWKAAIEYSPMQAAYQALEDTVGGLMVALRNPELKPIILKALESNLITSKHLQSVLLATKREAFIADTNKLNVLKDLYLLDQYAFETGGFKPTAEFKAAIQSKLDKLTSDIPSDLQKDLLQLHTTQVIRGFDDLKTKHPELSDISLTPDEVEKVVGVSNKTLTHLLSLVKANSAFSTFTEDMKKAVEAALSGNLRNSAFPLMGLVAHLKSKGNIPLGSHGVLGTPAIQPDIRVSRLLSRLNAVGDIDDLSKGLLGLLNNKGHTADIKFQQQLLKQLMTLFPKGTKYQIVQGHWGSGIRKESKDNSAWYDPNNKTVFILGPDFVGAKLQVETLLHEMTHAALAWAIENPTNQQQKEAVAALKEMMKEAQSWIDSHPKDVLFQQHAHKVKDIQEFVAYGLTDAKFQRQVIGAMKSKVKTHSTWTGKLKEFVAQIAKILFSGFKDSAFTNATKNLEVFFSQTQALMAFSQKAEDSAIQEGLSKLSKPLPMEARIDAFTTQQVFDALPQDTVSDGFNQVLSRRLSDLVGTLHGPFGAIKAKIDEQIGKTELDAWANAQARGERPFQGKVIYAGLSFSPREAFVAEQLEAAMQTLLQDKSSAGSTLYKEIEKVFAASKEQLKGKIDEDLYKFVFLPQRSLGNKSDYMGRFVALGLSHEGFAKALGFEVTQKDMEFSDKTPLGKLETLWRGTMDWLGTLATGTQSRESADYRLETLVRKMAEVEVRSRDEVKSRQPFSEFLEKSDEVAKGLVAGAKTKIAEAAESSFIQKNPLSLVRATGKAVSLAARDQAENIIQGIMHVRNRHNDEAYGDLMETINFTNGNSQEMDEALRIATKIQGRRQDIQASTAQNIRNSFKDGGAYLTKEDSASITSVLLRTGAHKLKDMYRMMGLKQLLTNDQARRQAIQKEVAALSGYKEANHYITQAKGLARMRITGFGAAMQMQNAYLISRMAGVSMNVPGHAAQAEPHIERLIALYALDFAQAADRNRVASVLDVENQRATGNGIQTTLDLQERFEKEALDSIFRGNKAQMMHGYLPEVTDPRVSLAFAKTEDEAKKLEAQGFVFVEDVRPDPSDEDQTSMKMYALKGVGLSRYTSGALSQTGTNHRGESKFSNYYNPLDSIGIQNTRDMVKLNAKMMKRALDQAKSGIISSGHNTLVPIVNEKGQVVDYRYMMKERNRDVLLNRDNRFDHLLGMSAASTYDKTASREQNKVVVGQLKKLFDQESKNDKERFIFVGAKSFQKDMHEHWSLIPDNTKRDIKEIWGEEGMWVPKEMVRPLFGYRNLSAANMFFKDESEFKGWKGTLQKGFVDTTKWLYEMYGMKAKGMSPDEAKAFTNQAGVMVRKAEDFWLEVVKEKKDAIVVKTGHVLWGNITSNMSLLLMNGMSVKDFILYQKEALEGVMDYERDKHALNELELRMGTLASVGQEEVILAEIARLKDSIARNPVLDLIEGGLLPSIVEDVDTEDENPYSYKSSLVNWSDKYTSKLHPTIRTLGRYAYMSHDTVLYKFLFKATQYSDFVARYALYKHQTDASKGEKALSKKEAMDNASKSFMNYTNPLPQSLHWLDAMGFAPFLKYALGIQRVLFKLFKTNPIQVISIMLMKDQMGNVPIVTDTSVFLRNTVPMGNGALGFPMTLPDIMTGQMAEGLIK